MTFFYPVRSTHRLTFPYSKTCGEIGKQGFHEKPMRGAAAGRFFVGVRSGGSAVPGKEGRSAAAGQRSARTSENEKSFSASPSLPTV